MGHKLNIFNASQVDTNIQRGTFCSGMLWGINPFDQWGVELGKEIGVQVLGRLSDDSLGADMDPSTEALIAAWRDA